MISADAAAAAIPLTSHWAGYAALAVFATAYLMVMGEEKLGIRKSKPVILAAGVIWALIAAAYVGRGDRTTAAEAVRHSIGEYGELFLFILVAMTFVNTMEERQVFDSLRAWMVRRRFSLRTVFWLTGLMSFLISSQLDNLTTALVMGTVVLTVGRGHPRFIGVGCISVVVASNAGGAFSPFGDITTLMVWQSGKAGFWEFFSLFLPSVVNWLIPAILMSFAVPALKPEVADEDVQVRRGGLGVVGLFAVTIIMAVSAYNVLGLPPVLGMTTGLGLLKLYGLYLQRTAPRPALATVAARAAAVPQPVLAVGPACPDPDGSLPDLGSSFDLSLRDPPGDGRGRETGGFDIFEVLRRSEWDTLLFFYGIILCVGGLAQIGYLAGLSQALYGGLGPTAANVGIGLISAVIDNIPVMYAVLTMNPAMDLSQWLLVTLTAGVGGSLLSVGSAAGVGLMGQSRGQYTFLTHLRWSWAIALGYAASIWVHLLVNG